MKSNGRLYHSQPNWAGFCLIGDASIAVVGSSEVVNTFPTAELKESEVDGPCRFS